MDFQYSTQNKFKETVSSLFFAFGFYWAKKFHFHIELINQNCSRPFILKTKNCSESNHYQLFLRRYLNWVSAIKEIAVVVVVFFAAIGQMKNRQKKLRWILTTGTLFAVIRWLNFMIEEWLSASRSIITGISHLISYSVAGVNHLKRFNDNPKIKIKIKEIECVFLVYSKLKLNAIKSLKTMAWEARFYCKHMWANMVHYPQNRILWHWHWKTRVK